MKKYDIYGIGAAIVDTEVVVTPSSFCETTAVVYHDFVT